MLVVDASVAVRTSLGGDPSATTKVTSNELA